MALIALAADKGSPGVTTAAVALAAVWPRRVLLAETDPAGGDLVYRSAAAHGGPLNPNTGMLSIAATARRGLVPDQLWDHVQPLSGGLEVLVGLGVAEQAAGLAGLWPTLGRAFASLADSPNAPADVIADCGRISGDTPAVELFPHASLVLLISRTEPEALARVRDRAAALAGKLHGGSRGAATLNSPVIGVVLVADPGNAAKLAGQVNDMLVHAQTGARVVGTLADDPAGAEQLAGRRRGRLDKSLLIPAPRRRTVTAARHAARPPPEALQQQSPTQIDDASADIIVAALILNARLRGPGLRQVLGALAKSAREEVDMRQRVMAQRASTRRSVQIVVAVSIAFVLGLSIFNRDFVEPYGTAVGQVVLACVCGLFALGFWWLRKLSTIETPERFLVRDDSSVRLVRPRTPGAGPAQASPFQPEEGVRR
ncbi:hypothetical protein SALBM217S_09815 [Streptomyces griseoloalbus]